MQIWDECGLGIGADDAANKLVQKPEDMTRILSDLCCNYLTPLPIQIASARALFGVLEAADNAQMKHNTVNSLIERFIEMQKVYTFVSVICLAFWMR